MKKLFFRILVITFTMGATSGFGQSWEKVGQGLKGYITDYAVFDGNLYVCSDGIYNSILEFDGNTWVNFESELVGEVKGLEVIEDHLYAITSVDEDGNPGDTHGKLYKLENDDWVYQSTYDGTVDILFSFKGKPGVVGNEPDNSGSADGFVAVWDNPDWTVIGEFSSHTTGAVNWQNQLVIMGQSYIVKSMKSPNFMVSWNGLEWTNTAKKLDFKHHGFSFYPSTCVHDGNLFISDDWITGVKGVEANGASVYSWDGSTWTDTELAGSVKGYEMVSHNGELVALSRANDATSVYKFIDDSWTKVVLKQGDVSDMTLTDAFVYNNELYAIGFVYDQNPELIGVAKLDILKKSSIATTQRELSLYPNPSSTQVTLKTSSSESFVYQMVNIHGQLCRQGILLPNGSIDLLNLPKGPYFVKLTSSETSNTSMLKVFRF